MGLIRTENSSRNYIINGAFDFWQRQQTFASAATVIYSADRFFIGRDAFATGMTLSRQASTGTMADFCARVQRDSGNSNTGSCYLMQLLEIQNAKELAGKTVNISFRARRGANFSAASNQIRVRIAIGTGSTQQAANTVFNSGFTGHTVPLSQLITINSTSSFDRYSANVTIPSTATQLYVEFSFAPTGTAGAADYFEITEISLNEGLNFSPFKRAGETYGGELSICQRFFEKSYDVGVNPGTATFNGSVQSRSTSTDAFGLPGTKQQFSSSKRASPTITRYSPNSGAVNNVYIDNPAGDNGTGLIVNIGMSGFTFVTPSNLVNAGGTVSMQWIADSEI